MFQAFLTESRTSLSARFALEYSCERTWGSMGTIILKVGKSQEVFPLFSSTLVGRNPRCHLVIPDLRVPQHWLEINSC